MIREGAGFELVAVVTLSVMRAGVKTGSGPSTTRLARFELFEDGVVVLTVACVPVVNQDSVRAAMGLFALPEADRMTKPSGVVCQIKVMPLVRD